MFHLPVKLSKPITTYLATVKTSGIDKEVVVVVLEDKVESLVHIVVLLESAQTLEEV